MEYSLLTRAYYSLAPNKDDYGSSYFGYDYDYDAFYFDGRFGISYRCLLKVWRNSVVLKSVAKLIVSDIIKFIN